MMILVVGDVHGEFHALSDLLLRENPDLVFQVGDFGVWPTALDSLKKLWPITAPPLYFAEGNHEHYPTLRRQWEAFGRRREAIPIAGQIYWMPRGATLTLPDGRVVCFLGGGKSVDHPLREKGRDWFEEELLDSEILDQLPAHADIVISHTAPRCLGIAAALNQGRTLEDWLSVGWDVTPDPSEEILDKILDRLKPSLWYFGHFHRPLSYRSRNCKFVCLAPVGELGSWGWLPQTPEEARREIRTMRRRNEKESDARNRCVQAHRDELRRIVQRKEDPWPWLEQMHVDDLEALTDVLEKDSSELQLVRQMLDRRKRGKAMELIKHHVDYLPPGSADVWDERILPPGPFLRRKLIVYYTQGSWLWAKAMKGGPAILLASYHTWKPGYKHRMGGPIHSEDVALEICARIDGMGYAERCALIAAQQAELLEAERRLQEMQNRPFPKPRPEDLDF
ncbi:metallophosphoesterase [Desulfovibrio aminophilus]|nr:metallophosphoesterase [Desulfovibrio aminophilus]MCM0754184.1 metallophosphoesterase [Desulfovibrio aminophilus]